MYISYNYTSHVHLIYIHLMYIHIHQKRITDIPVSFYALLCSFIQAQVTRPRPQARHPQARLLALTRPRAKQCEVTDSLQEREEIVQVSGKICIHVYIHDFVSSTLREKFLEYWLVLCWLQPTLTAICL